MNGFLNVEKWRHVSIVFVWALMAIFSRHGLYAQNIEASIEALLSKMEEQTQGLNSFQNALNRSRYHMNGFSFAFGLHQSRFLNPTFSRLQAEDIIRSKTGFRLAWEYTWFPFFGGAGYFESNFRIHDYEWSYPDGANVKHNGLDLTGGMFLMHATTRILPYLAASVQSGSLQVSESFLESSTDKKLTPSSTVTSGVILRAGLQSRIYRKIRIQGEYLRSIGASERSFYGFWFGLNIALYKP